MFIQYVPEFGMLEQHEQIGKVPVYLILTTLVTVLLYFLTALMCNICIYVIHKSYLRYSHGIGVLRHIVHSRKIV